MVEKITSALHVISEPESARCADTRQTLSVVDGHIMLTQGDKRGGYALVYDLTELFGESFDADYIRNIEEHMPKDYYPVMAVGMPCINVRYKVRFDKDEIDSCRIIRESAGIPGYDELTAVGISNAERYKEGTAEYVRKIIAEANETAAKRMATEEKEMIIRLKKSVEKEGEKDE